MIATVLGLLVVFGRLAPSSAVGRPLWWLAARIAERLPRVRTVHVVLVVLALASLAALIAYAQLEGAMIALPIGADALGYVAAIDVGAYVEVMALAWLIGAAGALRAATHVARAMAQRGLGPQRARRPVRRAPRVGRRRRAAPEDEDPAGWSRLPLAA